MTDDTSDDWSQKVNKFASQSKELASKGLESSKKISKSIATKSKNVASKSLESGKSVAHKISEKSQKAKEKRKEKKAMKKDTSLFEVQPLTDEVQVSEGQLKEPHDAEDYSRHTMNDLKMRLKLLGLAVNGKKAVLIERLKSSRKEKKKVEEVSVLDELEIKIQQIEEDYPEVLKPLPPDREEVFVENLKHSFYYICGFTFIIYSILLLLPTVLGDRLGERPFGVPFIEFFLPSWFSPEHIEPMSSQLHTPFVAIGAFIVFSSGMLLLRKNNFGTTLLALYFIGILLIGRLVYFFQSGLAMDATDYSNILHDIFLTFIVIGFAFLPRLFTPITDTENTENQAFSHGKASLLAESPNTSERLEHIIQEGFHMDFRAEVAKPKPPRARAKFEAYEKILLIVSFILWPFTIFMTMSYDNGLSAYTDYSSGIVQVVAVWTLSLLTLISLIRFDRSARGNGWYAKEKETYVGMMDLYSKAQAKHYEYVELRAAAEAQEILEKYPQLDKAKSASASKA